MMNGCAIQQNAFATCDEMRTPFTVPERKDPVLCPKPRRLSQLAGADSVRLLRWHFSHQAEPYDIFLKKGGEQSQAVESSPPFFCGSPPTRSANPLVHDARFGEATPVGDLMNPHPITWSGAPSATVKKWCARTKFGHAPAAVRIEGFDCLDRDRSRSRGIPTVA